MNGIIYSTNRDRNYINYIGGIDTLFIRDSLYGSIWRLYCMYDTNRIYNKTISTKKKIKYKGLLIFDYQ